MTRAKKRISILLIAALVISMFMAFSAVNVNAKGKKCNHKSTTTSYSNNGSNNHYKVVKCKSCGKQISKTQENCYGNGAKKSFSRDSIKTHKTKYTCKCGRTKTVKEKHVLHPADKKCTKFKCSKCGLVEKTKKFEAVGLP